MGAASLPDRQAFYGAPWLLFEETIKRYSVLKRPD